MAITRSQQAKQMLQDGGRIGLKAGAQFDTSLGGGAISPGTDISGQFRGGDSGGDGGGNKLTSTIVDTAKEIIPYVVQPKIKGIIDLIRTLKDTDFDIITKAEGSELSEDELNLQKAINQKQLENKKLKELLPGGEITDVVPDLTNLDVLNKIAIDAGLPTEKKGIIGARKDVATPGSSSAIKSIQNLKRNTDNPDVFSYFRFRYAFSLPFLIILVFFTCSKVINLFYYFFWFYYWDIFHYVVISFLMFR